MKTASETNKNKYIIQKDVNGKWFGYYEETKEYTPSFINFEALTMMFMWKGYIWHV